MGLIHEKQGVTRIRDANPVGLQGLFLQEEYAILWVEELHV
jgi:hypothetical protein